MVSLFFLFCFGLLCLLWCVCVLCVCVHACVCVRVSEWVFDWSHNGIVPCRKQQEYEVGHLKAQPTWTEGDQAISGCGTKETTIETWPPQRYCWKNKTQKSCHFARFLSEVPQDSRCKYGWNLNPPTRPRKNHLRFVSIPLLEIITTRSWRTGQSAVLRELGPNKQVCTSHPSGSGAKTDHSTEDQSAGTGVNRHKGEA